MSFVPQPVYGSGQMLEPPSHSGAGLLDKCPDSLQPDDVRIKVQAEFRAVGSAIIDVNLTQTRSAP